MFCLFVFACVFLILAFNNLENQITHPITDDEREGVFSKAFYFKVLLSHLLLSILHNTAPQIPVENVSKTQKKTKITEISKSRKSLDDLVGLQPQGKCSLPALRHHEPRNLIQLAHDRKKLLPVHLRQLGLSVVRPTPHPRPPTPTHTGHFPRGSSGVVAAYIVAERILSPATMYVDFHGTYYRWTARIVAHRHILSPDGTYCRPLSHTVAGRHILSHIVTYCRRRQYIPLRDGCVVCLRGGGKRQTDRQTDRDGQRQRHKQRHRDRANNN